MWGCVFSVYPFPLWWLREYTYFVLLSSSNQKYELLPIFRVRSWNNGMRCMSFYILMAEQLHELVLIALQFEITRSLTVCSIVCFDWQQQITKLFITSPLWEDTPVVNVFPNKRSVISEAFPCHNILVLGYKHPINIGFWYTIEYQGGYGDINIWIMTSIAHW